VKIIGEGIILIGQFYNALKESIMETKMRDKIIWAVWWLGITLMILSFFSPLPSILGWIGICMIIAAVASSFKFHSYFLPPWPSSSYKSDKLKGKNGK
jgi:hypothetical protein